MTLCDVCTAKESKYTCPKCKWKYCSLVCFKDVKHKEHDEEILSQKEEHANEEKIIKEEVKPTAEDDGSDPMMTELLKNEQFQDYISSPVLQFHILSIIEIINNIGLTNEYSKEGRLEIASRKLNNLREGGLEENEFVEEFVQWLLQWLETYRETNK